MQDHTLPETPLRHRASGLLAALDTYELTSARLVDRWLDMDIYRDCSTQIDAIREQGVTSPALTVLSLQLVIAHSELVGTMWQNASKGVCEARLQEVKDRHALAINALRSAAASCR
jgi:hypothetical protein